MDISTRVLKINYSFRLIFFALLIANASLGQDFKRGFVVMNNGDSLDGFVSNSRVKGGVEKCYFQWARGAETKEFLASQIKSYGFFNGKNYESKKIAFESGASEWKFAEVIVKGLLTLYRYQTYILFEKDSLLLVSKIQSKQTLGNLSNLVADCDVKKDGISYTEKRIAEIVNAYNQCKGASLKILKSRAPKRKFAMSIITGIDWGTQRLNGFTSYSMGKSTSIPIGLGTELLLPRVNDKLYISAELWYDKKLYQGYGETTSNGSITRSDLLLNSSYIRMPVGFRINLSKQDNSPYVRVGYSHYFLVNFSSSLKSETETNGVVIVNNPSDGGIRKKNANGVWAGAGLGKKIGGRMKIFFELRYEVNTGFTDPYAYTNSFGSAANLLLGLKF